MIEDFREIEAIAGALIRKRSAGERRKLLRRVA